MPMPPYPPAQVTRTVTWVCRKGGLEIHGTPSGNVDWSAGNGFFASPKVFGSGPASVSFQTFMFLNGSGTPSDGEDEPDLPDIVNAAWSWQARIYNNTDPIGPYFAADGPPTVAVQIGVSSDSASAVHTPGDPVGTIRPQNFGGGGDIFGFSPLDWKLAIGSGSAGQGDPGVMSCDNPPSFVSASFALGYVDLSFGGGATWLAWWWRLEGTGPNGDGKDACGNHQPLAPYIYRREDPSDETGFPWEKFDPDDPDAHPTPVVLSVEPSHGAVRGGELITIRGDGFGTEATVTFDGVPATDVNVIDFRTIQCRNPSHIAGYANVVVTNFDGISS